MIISLVTCILQDWAVAVISSMEAAQNDTQYGLVGVAIESGLKAGGKIYSATLAALSQEQSSSGCNYLTNPVLAGNLVSQYEAQSGSCELRHACLKTTTQLFEIVPDSKVSTLIDVCSGCIKDVLLCNTVCPIIGNLCSSIVFKQLPV